MEAEANSMTDGRMVGVRTRVPVWPKHAGGGEEVPNNQSEQEVTGVSRDDEIGGEVDGGEAGRRGSVDHG